MVERNEHNAIIRAEFARRGPVFEDEPVLHSFPKQHDDELKMEGARFTVEGELTKPEGSYLLNRNKTRFQSLIKLRGLLWLWRRRSGRRRGERCEPGGARVGARLLVFDGHGSRGYLLKRSLRFPKATGPCLLQEAAQRYDSPEATATS